MAEIDIEEGFVDISDEQDRGLMKKILVEGTGDATPPAGSSVEVHYVGTLHSDGSGFDSSRDRPGNFKFDVGVGQVIMGWDQGILTMKKGEKCILRCTSDYAYGDRGSPPKIPGGATLNFEVELFNWKEKVKTASRMTAEERTAHATKMKDQGTEAFKLGDFATAVNRYEDGAQYITFDAKADDDDDDDDHDHGHSHGGAPCSGHGGDDDDDMGHGAAHGHGAGAGAGALSEDDKKLAVALLNNCAMARMKLGDAEPAMLDCEKVLQYDEKNVKAMFRRAECHLKMANYSLCVADADKTLEIDPGNKAAEALKLKAAHEEKAAKQKEKAMYSKMFG
mmetsp:Transcript_98830/g.283900  ORF Transcript_98830/g.283900 Transcript_98830/m.283900 type:complete len:336 (+) Transcript_98830:66-1073(+)